MKVKARKASSELQLFFKHFFSSETGVCDLFSRDIFSVSWRHCDDEDGWPQVIREQHPATMESPGGLCASKWSHCCVKCENSSGASDGCRDFQVRG